MSVQTYPRLANLFAYSLSSDAPVMSRYALVVSNSPGSISDPALVPSLRALSPQTKLIFYQAVQEVLPSRAFDGMTMYPGWYVPLAPSTTLASPIGTSDTSLVVNDATAFATYYSSNTNVFLVVGQELMQITNVSGTTISVTRGQYGVTPSSHAANDSTNHAVHLLSFAYNNAEILTNVTQYCPADGNGKTWAQYFGPYVATQVTRLGMDGVFGDNTVYNWQFRNSGGLDVDFDNTKDWGDGASQSAWSDGLTTLVANWRTALPTQLLIGNGGLFAGQDGQEFEIFPTPYGLSGDKGKLYTWNAGLAVYLAYAKTGGLAPSSILNPDTTLTSNAIDLPTMRLGLGCALLGDGYYTYDSSTALHGSTWWFDEYDKGAGSSLASGCGLTDTTLTLVAGTGSRFNVGDIVYVPNDSGFSDLADEVMTVTGISTDVLSVSRPGGVTHAAGTKVFTAAQIAAGLGWLGLPTGAAVSLGAASLGPTLVQNGSFETWSAGSPSHWTLSTNTVTSNGVSFTGAATLVQDTSSFTDGASSVEVAISAAAPNSDTAVQLAQFNIGPITSSTDYTITFSVKAARSRLFQLVVHDSVGNLLACTLPAHPSWVTYQIPFTTNVNPGTLTIDLNLSRTSTAIWFDAVQIQQGNVGWWRRDYQHGSVLVNLTPATQTLTLDTGYGYIAGTQDRVHNPGGTATTVNVASKDALLLPWTSPTTRTYPTRTYTTRTYTTRTYGNRRPIG